MRKQRENRERSGRRDEGSVRVRQTAIPLGETAIRVAQETQVDRREKKMKAWHVTFVSPPDQKKEERTHKPCKTGTARAQNGCQVHQPLTDNA